MTLNELRDKIHQNAVNKGFYDGQMNVNELPSELRSAFIAQRIALIHSELSEALEADRKNSYALLRLYEQSIKYIDSDHESENFLDRRIQIQFEECIKDSFEDELADAMIRILDLCGWLGIDIDTHIKLKMDYNESRVQKHGKRY